MAKNYVNLAEALALMREGWLLERWISDYIPTMLVIDGDEDPRPIRASTYTALCRRGLVVVKWGSSYTLYALREKKGRA